MDQLDSEAGVLPATQAAHAVLSVAAKEYVTPVPTGRGHTDPRAWIDHRNDPPAKTDNAGNGTKPARLESDNQEAVDLAHAESLSESLTVKSRKPRGQASRRAWRVWSSCIRRASPRLFQAPLITAVFGTGLALRPKVWIYPRGELLRPGCSGQALPTSQRPKGFSAVRNRSTTSSATDRIPSLRMS